MLRLLRPTSNLVRRGFSTSSVRGLLGQPDGRSHPHLFGRDSPQDEVNAGLLRSEFAARRLALADAIRESDAANACANNINTSYSSRRLLAAHHKINRHLVVVPAAQKTFMYDNIPYPFRQNSDFRYLTGCLEPDCVFVMEVGQVTQKTHLFVRETNKRLELWEGTRSSADDGTAKFFGIDEVHTVTQLAPFLNSFKRESVEFCLWYEYLEPKCQKVHKVLMDFVHNISSEQGIIAAPRKVIQELRSVKSPAELDLMRRSCSIAAKSIAETISLTKSLSSEHELYATVDHKCRMKGAQYLAYPPVVAAGNNATTIHYTHNNQTWRESDLILMDAGCEYHGYTSDITRTWPASGRFTQEQRVVYEIVLETYKGVLERLAAGGPASIDELYREMQNVMYKLLQSAGILTVAEAGVTHRLCPHHVGHHLGMDVHDCSLISKKEILRPGMVITVEPGLYVPDGCEVARKEFQGTGIRIENDILIGKNGEFEVLSHECPIELAEVENLCNA